MSRARGWVAALTIFALGVAVGGAGTAWLGARMLKNWVQSPAGARTAADRMAERLSDDLTHELALTPEEAARVRTLLDESAAAMKRLRVRTALEIGAELRASTQRLQAALPAEKHAALRRVLAQRYERLGVRPEAKP